MDKKFTKSFKEKFVIDSGYIFTSIIFVNIFTTINSILIARVLGPEKLGIFSVIQYLGGLIIMFSSLNLPVTITTFIAEYRVTDKSKIGKTIGTLSLISITSSFILITLIILSSDFISNFYNEPSIGFLIKIYTLTIFFTVFSNLCISILAGFQEMKSVSKLNVILAITNIPITIMLVYYFSILGAILSLITNSIVSLLITLVLVLNLLSTEKVKIDFSFDKELLKKIIQFSLPLFLSGVAYTAFQWFGPTLLSMEENFKDVGSYKVALAIYNLILFVPNAIQYNLMPTVSNLSSSKPESLSFFVSNTLKIIMLLVLPVILAANLVSKELILILFGNAYTDSISATYILVISGFFVSIFSSMGAVLMGIKKTKTLMYIDIAFCLLFNISSYFLVKKLGLMGLASTYLSTYFILTLLCTFYISKYITLQYKLLGLPFIVCIIFLTSSFFMSYLFYGVSYYIVGVLLIIVALLIEWKLIDTTDKETIFRICEKLKYKILSEGSS
ncbi:MAG TPA: flippase [Methanosarcina sp.]|jgi:O-antigen/teichoic acid export membrane protein|nr:flippase [Methanosarcina sp.]